MKNGFGPLAKNVLILVGCRYSEKKNQSYGITTLAISNAIMEDIIKIVKSLEDLCIFWKDITRIIENAAKEQSGRFLSILLVNFFRCINRQRCS